MAKPTKQLLTAILLTASTFSTSSSIQAGRPTVAERAQQVRDRQIDAIEQKLSKLHGDDDWYVFDIISIRPEVSCSLTRAKCRNRSIDYASVTIQQRPETQRMTVLGHAAAAEIIWQGDRSPVMYQYSVFKQKFDTRSSTEAE